MNLVGTACYSKGTDTPPRTSKLRCPVGTSWNDVSGTVKYFRLCAKSITDMVEMIMPYLSKNVLS